MFYYYCITVSSSLHLFIVFDEWAGHSQGWGWGGVSFTVMGRWLASQVNQRTKKKSLKKQTKKKSKHTHKTQSYTHSCAQIKSYGIKHPGTNTDTLGCVQAAVRVCSARFISRSNDCISDQLCIFKITSKFNQHFILTER